MMNYIGHLNYLKGCGIIPNFSESERIDNRDRRTLKNIMIMAVSLKERKGIS